LSSSLRYYRGSYLTASSHQFEAGKFATKHAHAFGRIDLMKRQLGDVIKDHTTDATVRAAAKRATWLGNDETHYERRWEAMDIKDVKALVHLTVNAVENAMALAQYVEDMPEGKR
jgi:hypothetical protein